MHRWSAEADVETLRRAIRTYDADQVATVVTRFVEAASSASPPDAGETLEVMKELQNARHPVQVRRVAEASLRAGVRSTRLVHRYALSLLDTGLTLAADALLQTLDEDVRQNDTEVRAAEARVGKEIFLTAHSRDRRCESLARAISGYHAVYLENPSNNDYHGVNAAALLCRAAREGIELPGYPDPKRSAESIADAILASLEDCEWDDWKCATGAEAALVLGDAHLAGVWVTRYVRTVTHAFPVNSTLRQFLTLWELDPEQSPGELIVPLLQSRLLELGGALTVEASAVSTESVQRLNEVAEDAGEFVLERTFSPDGMRPIAWLAEALRAGQYVARVCTRTGDPLGTGFVLSGDFAGQRGWTSRVLVTNAHVVDGVPDDDLRVTFDGLGQDMKLVGGLSACWRGEPAVRADPSRMDICILEIPEAVASNLEPLLVGVPFPEESDYGTVQRAYVIGHPHGAEAYVSLHGTELRGVDERRARYVSPTERGSSGSPVFDKSWRVIAVHFGTEYDNGGQVNVGVRMDALIDHLNRVLGAPMLNAAV
jgi:hypothetical protein